MNWRSLFSALRRGRDTARRAAVAGIVFVLAASTACERRDAAAAPAVAAVPLIVDTDAGADDLMALAFLLALPDVRIEAVTVSLGLANIEPGARNVLRLLELAGRSDIPVYTGRATPLAGGRAFPDAWRALSDELPGVELPEARRIPAPQPAAEYLAERWQDAERPVDILALGALTTIAEALELAPRAPALRRLVIMGGAAHVPGNLHEAGENENVTAEWNFYVDAEAARRVFEAGLPIRLIPLDATDRVPFDREYSRQLGATGQPPLARLVAQLLDMVGFLIDVGNFYAWDPLAAVSLIDSTVVRLQPESIAIVLDPPEDGRTLAVPGRAANAQVAVDADEMLFREIFVGTLLEERR